MCKPEAIVVGILALLATARGDGPSSEPADFKIQVASFGLRKDPISTEEIVVHKGRAYVFPSESKEVIIIEPAGGRVGILDVGRRVQTEVLFRTLDESLMRIKATLRETAEKREKEGGKANIVEARMTRDLFETKLAIALDSRTNHVRLTNPAVEVDAEGEPEADAPRLAFVATTLAGIAKLGAFRTPNDLPPFAELTAITTLTGENRLRPTTLTYVYRLAGRPQKFHRTYRLVDRLTERELEAIVRVDQLREAVPSLRYERYRLAR